MSFVGKNSKNQPSNSKLNSNETKYNQKDKIVSIFEETMNKNNLITQQINQISRNFSITEKDIEHIENLMREIDFSLSTITNSLINMNEDRNRDRIITALKKEKTNLRNNRNKFEELKSSFYANNSNETNTHENSNLLHEAQKFKVSETQIKYMEDIAKYREEKMRHINEQIKYVDKLSKDTQFLTQKADIKIDTLVDNIDNTLHTQKETFKMVQKLSKEEKSLKDNKCCLMFLISIALMLIIIVVINMNSSK